MGAAKSGRRYSAPLRSEIGRYTRRYGLDRVSGRFKVRLISV
jgi:hypothetical protein